MTDMNNHIYCKYCRTIFGEECIVSEHEDHDTNELTVIFECPNCAVTYSAKKDDDGYYDFNQYFAE